MEDPSPSIPKDWARRFFAIWTGQVFSLFGSAIVQFALIWWLAQKSGSATVLALATLAGLLPTVVLGPFAGALVDRWNRRRIMMIADTTIAAFTLLLAYLFATGTVQIWHIYVILVVRALGGAFHFPAMAASTPLMVPENQLTRVNGLNQTLQGVNALIAPPVGALLIQQTSTAFYIRAAIVLTLAYFGYQTPNLPAFAGGGRFAREKLQDWLLGSIIGLVNGYLIVGSIWSYMAQAQYVGVEALVTPPLDPAVLKYLEYMPPVLLQFPNIIFAVIIGFVFVIVVFV